MSMRIFLLFTTVVAVALGVIFYTKASNYTKPTPTSSRTSSHIEETLTTKSNRYLAYSPQVFESAKNGKRILFFFANWCPTCLPVDNELETKSEQLPHGLTVIRVNYNDSDTDQDERSLAQKYAVTYQHTFIQIGSDGQEITRWNGGGLADLLANLN